MARSKHGGEPSVMLRKRLERSIAQGHPWLWRDAIEPNEAKPGEVIAITDRHQRFLARGVADSGPIAVRLWTTTANVAVDDALLHERLAQAIELRRRVVPSTTSGYRLVHGEGDRLPGIVCDVYDTTAVLKLDGDGAAAWRDRVVTALHQALPPLGVGTLLVRSGRGAQLISEVAFGARPTTPIAIRERGMTLLVDVLHGQKTGMFLDHRDSRARARELSTGARVLNLFGYTGGFSIAAGQGGASAVDTVDLAAPALALAEQSWSLNELPSDRHCTHRVDAFVFLERAVARGARYDLIIADPPSFAPNESAVMAALASYKKLHAACLGVLARGGLYLAASCSSHVRPAAFEDTLIAGAARARRSLQLLDAWGAAPDHPRLHAFPEGDYLKSMLVRAL